MLLTLYRTEGIILRVRPFGEADRILTILTRTEGVIEAVARGARRPRSRLVGATLPFTQIQAMIFRGKSLDNLSQAEIVNTFSAIREDLLRTAYGTYWCELAYEFMGQRDPNEEVYLFFLASLLMLDSTDDPGLLSIYFELRFLAQLGYRPALDCCCGCGKSMAEGGSGSFLTSSGGLLCNSCTQSNASGEVLSAAAVGFMRMLLVWDLRKLNVLKLPDTARLEVKNGIRRFAAEQSGKPLKSLDFLRSIEAHM